MKELPESKKFAHREVRYEMPSETPDEACAMCEHFIDGEENEKPRCQIVVGPIAPEAWCKKFELDPELSEELAEEDEGKDTEQLDLRAYRRVRGRQRRKATDREVC